MDSEERSLCLLIDIMAETFFTTPRYFNILRNTSRKNSLFQENDLVPIRKKA